MVLFLPLWVHLKWADWAISRNAMFADDNISTQKWPQNRKKSRNCFASWLNLRSSWWTFDSTMLNDWIDVTSFVKRTCISLVYTHRTELIQLDFKVGHRVRFGLQRIQCTQFGNETQFSFGTHEPFNRPLVRILDPFYTICGQKSSEMHSTTRGCRKKNDNEMHH